MALDVGAVVGRLEMALKGWKDAVDTVKKDQQSLTGFAIRHSDQIKKLGMTFTATGAVITGTIGLLVKKTADYGDTLNDLSQRTGIATDVLSTFKLAADKSGTSLDGLATGMKGLSRVMADAASGGKEANQLLRDVGSSATDSSGKIRPLDRVMLDVADRFASMADGAAKNDLAMRLFGKAGMDLIPMLNLGRAGLEANAAAAQRLGLVMSAQAAKACDDFNDSVTELKGGVQGLGIQIGQALMPPIQALVEKATSAVAGIRAWAAEHPGLVSGLGQAALAVGGLLSVLGPMMIAMVSIIKNMVAIKTALGLFQGGLMALISPAGLVTAGVIALLTAIAPGRTVIEKFANVVSATISTIRSWAQAIQEAHAIVSQSWFAKSFKTEIAQRISEARAEAERFRTELKVFTPSMEKLQGVMEMGPAVWKKWKDEVSATDRLLYQNRETIIGWINTATDWLGLTNNAAFSSSALGKSLVDLGVKTKTQLTAELQAAEAALNGLRASTEATPGQIKVLEDKIAEIKEQIYGAARETNGLGVSLKNVIVPTENAHLQLENLGKKLELLVTPKTRELSSLIDQFTPKLVDIKWDAIPENAEPAIKETKNYFDGLFNDIASGFGNTIQEWLSGATTFKDFLLGLWGNIKDAFFRMVGQMAAEWAIKFVKNIIDSTVEVAGAIAKNVGKSVSDIASSAGKAASGFLSALGSVGSIISGIASVIDLLKGPQKQTDVTYWLKFIKDLTQEIHDFLINNVFAFMKGSMQPAIDDIKKTAWSMNSWLSKIYSVIGDLVKKIQPAATGYAGIVKRPTLFLAGESGPEPVLIGAGVEDRVIPSSGAGQGRGVTLNATFNVTAIDSAGVEAFLRNKARPILQRMLEKHELQPVADGIRG